MKFLNTNPYASPGIDVVVGALNLRGEFSPVLPVQRKAKESLHLSLYPYYQKNLPVGEEGECVGMHFSVEKKGELVMDESKSNISVIRSIVTALSTDLNAPVGYRVVSEQLTKVRGWSRSATERHVIWVAINIESMKPIRNQEGLLRRLAKVAKSVVATYPSLITHK